MKKTNLLVKTLPGLRPTNVNEQDDVDRTNFFPKTQPGIAEEDESAV
jgi:hypothetical protein